MAESNSFSSLLALVDDHLSKTKIQSSRSEAVGGLPIPTLTIQNGTQSETRMSPNGHEFRDLPLPSFNFRNNSISQILAEQVANMLKAKEKKQQEEEEEKLRLEKEMQELSLKEAEDDCVIDLMKALQESVPSGVSVKRKSATVSTTSSMESLFEPMFISCDDEASVPQTPEPILPCKTDMSYILKQKIEGKGKCSNFGRVLAARYKPVTVPYVREKIESNIVRFDFKTKSPCDLIKENLSWKPVYQSPAEIYGLVSHLNSAN